MGQTELLAGGPTKVLNFLKEKESGLSPSDLYDGGVNYAFDELRGVISYLKWVHVHLCFNGELAPLLNNPFKSLHVQFEQLLGALPSPGVPLEDNFGVGMIKKYRLDLTLERSTFNRTLIFDRDSLKKPPPSKEERQESVQLRRVVEAHRFLCDDRLDRILTLEFSADADADFKLVSSTVISSGTSSNYESI
ncbi:hypothetical protein F2Q68_00037060 [Brassica cretica]|uniref:Uncharacterized protein n=1 Tax=Brassica cretica TaxID=69181 RepID=A0A8S9GV35_BRACR|nr:hypothetical protein F2Q68_00037060 [Brassica cretica]